MKPTMTLKRNMHAIWGARISFHLLCNAKNRFVTFPCKSKINEKKDSQYLLFPQLDAMMPKIHLLYPMTLVRGLWEDVMSQAHSLITSSWTFYLQADDGEIVIFQVRKEKAIAMSYWCAFDICHMFCFLFTSLNLKSSISRRLSWKNMRRKKTHRKAVRHPLFFFSFTPDVIVRWLTDCCVILI